MEEDYCPECSNNPHYLSQDDEGNPCRCRTCGGYDIKYPATINLKLTEEEIKAIKIVKDIFSRINL